jgi:hypothetical protein
MNWLQIVSICTLFDWIWLVTWNMTFFITKSNLLIKMLSWLGRKLNLKAYFKDIPIKNISNLSASWFYILYSKLCSQESINVRNTFRKLRIFWERKMKILWLKNKGISNYKSLCRMPWLKDYQMRNFIWKSSSDKPSFEKYWGLKWRDLWKTTKRSKLPIAI